LLLTTSCIDEDFSIGNEYLKNNMRVVMIDTCTVSLSTVQADSIKTSGLGAAWVGKFNDKYFGQITACSYMSFSLPTYAVKQSAVYDSASLILKFYSDICGDTMQSQKLSVHRLSQVIDLDDEGFLYNTSSVPVEPDPIATCVFKPRPGSGKEVKIRLPDEIYKDLFDKLMDQASEVSSDDKFTNYFKGLALLPDTLQNTVINSFIVCD
jgi:hypothetical protein